MQTIFAKSFCVEISIPLCVHTIRNHDVFWEHVIATSFPESCYMSLKGGAQRIYCYIKAFVVCLQFCVFILPELVDKLEPFFVYEIFGTEGHKT
jgi:hypothetical protein